MKKIGITGNIGSGKTLVCSIFEAFQIPVFYADKEAKKIYSTPEIYKQMVSRFGKSVYNSDKTIKSAVLAKKLFNNNDHLHFVNEIIHPAVHHYFDEWLKSFESKPYILYEAAILIETGYYKDFDAIVLVTAPENTRIERILERDKTSLKDVYSRISRQMNEEKKMEFADFIIQNDGKKMLIPQVMNIHRLLTNTSS